MIRKAPKKTLLLPLLAGIVVFLTVMAVSVSMAAAAPAAQEGDTSGTSDPACKNCHPDIAESWTDSPHANAFTDPIFQERWNGLGDPKDCLLCHTTGYQATTGDYHVPGVSCEACHGISTNQHPLGPMPIRADTEYCGACHTNTLHEWRLSGHASAEVGCTDCHDPHSQERLFEVSDDMCINCHKDDMDKFTSNLHIEKNVGCVDCHTMVIPPEEPPTDGILETGHTFAITPETCVACHSDVLHAGEALPGYENGAKAAASGESTELGGSEELIGMEEHDEETQLTHEQKLQAYEAALASNQISKVFQGGVIGLVLGGSTAWFVSQNVRRSFRKDEDEE